MTLKLQSKILELGRGAHSANIPILSHQENASCTDTCRDTPTTTRPMSTLLALQRFPVRLLSVGFDEALSVCRVARHELILGRVAQKKRPLGAVSLAHGLWFRKPEDLNFFQMERSTRAGEGYGPFTYTRRSNCYYLLGQRFDFDLLWQSSLGHRNRNL
jgi:hypothetical protein